jgi:hypothetical protein
MDSNKSFPEGFGYCGGDWYAHFAPPSVVASITGFAPGAPNGTESVVAKHTEAVGQLIASKNGPAPLELSGTACLFQFAPASTVATTMLTALNPL